MGGNEAGLQIGWNDPELRAIWVADALAERDLEKLAEGMEHYLRTHRGRSERTAAEYVRAMRDFLVYLWYDRGRAEPEAGDAAAWLEDLRERGPHFQRAAGRPRRPLRAGSLRSYRAGLVEARNFFEWSEAAAFAKLSVPPAGSERRLRVVSDGEYEALRDAARRRPGPGRELDLALLAMLGEEGWPLKKVAWMRVADYAGLGRLRMREGPYAVSPAWVDLTEPARAALESWLEAREGLAAGGSLPAGVWISPRSLGELDDSALRQRLRERAAEAGVTTADLVRGLRNRAAVRLRDQLGSATAVAKRLGLALPPDVLRKRKQTIEGGI